MTDQEVIHDLGIAVFNISYPAFREALGLEDDHYARDKYRALAHFARAMGPFTDSALAALTAAYRHSLTRPTVGGV